MLRLTHARFLVKPAVIPKRRVASFQPHIRESKVTFALNGVRKEEIVEPGTTILQYLRSTSVNLTGTKLGCEEGGCGACTVVLTHWDAETNKLIHRSVNACLTPFHVVDGHSLVTIEGIGNVKNLHPIQYHVSHNHGSQCGFCTPGIAMALYGFLSNNPQATKEQIEDSFDGNLCRCTGYRPILDAAKIFGCELYQNHGTEKANSTDTVCPSSKKACSCGHGVSPSTYLTGGTEPSFPEFLKNYTFPSLQVFGKRVAWLRPTSLQELLQYKQKYGENSFISIGSTEISVEVKFKHANYPVLIAPTNVPELNSISADSNGVNIGAAVSLNDIKDFFMKEISERPEFQTRSLRAIVDQLRWFAGNQIRNVACLGGNLATASPISDINPILMAIGATILVQSQLRGSRTVKIDRKFFTGYRKVALQPDEVVISINIPFTKKNEFVRAFKQARRRDDDIAIVSAGMKVELHYNENSKTYVVKEASFGFGGLAPVTVDAPKTSAQMVGKTWDKNLFKLAVNLLEKDLPLPANAPGGMVPFRRTLAPSFFYKFFLFVNKSLGIPVPDSELLGIDEIPARPVSRGQQTFAKLTAKYPVSEPVMHINSLKQVTGEAIYIDDMEMPSRGLYGCFAVSSKANAKILSIDPSVALKMEGVVDFISAKDIPGHNDIGPVIKGELLFATDHVAGVGYPIGLIIAKTHRQAEEAARQVIVNYQELEPILTIEKAIEKQSFWRGPVELQRGNSNMDQVFSQCDHVIEGSVQVGGQDHFYLETQVSHVEPGEDSEMIIYSSTQNPSETQLIVAEVLGIPSNRVVCKMKRMGGGFGGKETRSIFVSAAAAVAAKKLHRPIRIVLDRDDDMLISGGRHPFLGKYKVGFQSDGTLTALYTELYSNGGWSLDLSGGVLERALFHVDNAYFIPNVWARGWVCKTNIASSTAFRGFGGPQSMLITETWIEHVAKTLGKHPSEIRRKNLYKEGQITHYNQQLAAHDATVQKCFDHVISMSDFHKREVEVQKFNSSNLLKKRGIAVIPTKFGMSFTVRHLNQAGALVHIYKDGSVLVSHGGTEMGQGLNTKVVQVVAKALGVSMNDVHIMETATDKVANTAPTAASVQSDLNCMAALKACNEINERLQPLRQEFPDLPLSELAKKAWIRLINLSAHGHFGRPHVGYDFNTKSGRPFEYFVTGAACSEVELDVLTGDHHVIRTDLVMDLGESLSPAVDIGQIEGAFVQGYGWTTLEEVVYLPDGRLHTRGPGAYKLPGFKDIPAVFNVHLLKDTQNPTTIHSSKGVGEPPLFLGATVFFALRNAVEAARHDNKSSNWFTFPSPATCERLRMACDDHFAKHFIENSK